MPNQAKNLQNMSANREDDPAAAILDDKPTYGQQLAEAFCTVIEHLPADKLPNTAGVGVTVNIELKSLIDGVKATSVVWSAVRPTHPMNSTGLNRIATHDRGGCYARCERLGRMVDEQQPAKKVVKRVVKKTVVRPASPPTETVRYGRPVAPRVPRAKAATRPVARPTTKARPRVEVGAKIGAAGRAVTSRGAGVASGVTGGARSVGRTTGSFVSGRFNALRDWRIPHLDMRVAAVIAGLVVGLVSVGLAVAALALFSEVRGVSSGGGRWGSLTFVVIAFVAFGAGALLLEAFGSSQARLTSFLGVVLTIVTILGAFLEVADSQWALVLVPLLGAVAYLVAHWLLVLAEGGPRLPE